MIKKILIANRGEIAVRIIRTCLDLGIQTVAIYSSADRDSLHVKLADEAFCIGAAPLKESYLKQDVIIHLAKVINVDAIHPGYGLLSENAHFAHLCEQMNITFIGPPSSAIKAMGLKDQARNIIQQSNVPVVPGSDGLVSNIDDAHQIAKKVSYPVIIKATAGGGGKGIRIARNEQQLFEVFPLAKNEATSVFQHSGLYVEKFIERFRHIEIQILADQHGNVVHLGERDCTIQRRMQKLIEEAPSPVIDDDMRKEMGEAAKRAATAVNYVGAGTVEFIYDLSNRKYYFMEMNTRIQVEHTITEEITGIDLIAEQIAIANGEELSFTQNEVILNGWAIECRINAEDPSLDFLPSPGTITFVHLPDGPDVRVDSAVYSNYTIPPYYDSMIAKVIVHGKDRNDAISKMNRALIELEIDGVPTTTPFLRTIVSNQKFIKGTFKTNMFDELIRQFKEDQFV